MKRNLVDRIARALALLACLWFAFASAWGCFGIVQGGHILGGASGTAAMSENMLRWRSIYPLWGWYLSAPPPLSDAYCHHPFGTYYLSEIALAIFGHRDFVIPLPAVVMSIATPPLLWSLGRTLWGEVAGAAAACGFVVLPIALGFADLHNLEVMTIFGWVLFFWGHAKHETTKKRRHMLASLAGVALATSADWIGYVAIGIVLGWALVRAFVLPKRLTPPIDFGRYARWWALCASLAVTTLVVWVGLFQHANKIGDWLASAELRGGQSDMPLKLALETRKTWIDMSFTPLAIALGKIAAPLCLLRLVVFRRDAEVYAPAVLAASVVQYVAFKRGADVHAFWPHHFALYFALALAILVSTAGGMLRFLLARLRVRRAAAAGAWVALASTVAFVALMAPDASRGLRIWRTTGGRYDDKGSPMRSSVDALWVVEQKIAPALPAGAVVDAHASIGWSWEHNWAARATERPVDAPPAALGPQNADHPFFIARASGLSPDDQRAIAERTHVRVYGDVWLVDEREPAAPLDAYRVEEREPNVLEWLLYGSELVRHASDAPDAFLTWEWRTHLGQDAPPPSAEPRSLDEMRIAHNAAVARGDAAAAERWREKIDRQIDRTVAARFDDGTRIVGARVVAGALPRLETWFEAGDGPRGDAVFVVRSAIERAEPLSWIPQSSVECDHAWWTPIPPKLHKSGFLYVSPVVLYHRVGYERYAGAWRSRDGSRPPARTDGQPFTTLAVVR